MNFDGEQLHFAARDGDLDRVQRLLASGCDVNAFDELGKTPLHYAVAREQFAIVQYLLDHGADVNARHEANIGDTPLGDVAATCSLRMATLLVLAGADPTIQGWMQLSALDRARNRQRGDGPQVHKLLVRAADARRGRRS